MPLELPRMASSGQTRFQGYLWVGRASAEREGASSEVRLGELIPVGRE